jgi:hypothetical protein
MGFFSNKKKKNRYIDKNNDINNVSFLDHNQIINNIQTSYNMNISKYYIIDTIIGIKTSFNYVKIYSYDDINEEFLVYEGLYHHNLFKFIFDSDDNCILLEKKNYEYYPYEYNSLNAIKKNIHDIFKMKFPTNTKQIKILNNQIRYLIGYNKNDIFYIKGITNSIDNCITILKRLKA